MGIFGRRAGPAFASAPIQAAAGAASQVGAFLSYQVGTAEERALSLPTISRARDLMASVVGSLDLRSYVLEWDGERYEKVYVPGESWFTRPDPKVTRNFFMANIFSDLFFYGRAFAYVTARYSTGFPSAMTWLPQGNISTEDQAGPQWFGPSDQITFNGIEVPTENVIQFYSPIQGVVYMGARAIDIALRLDLAAKRFASNEIAAGYLQQVSGEPLDADDLADLASAWATARQTNAIGALNEAVKFVEFSSDPSKLQLTEARQFASLQLANVANVPPYLVGAPTGSTFTYQNAQQARQDLVLFGAMPYLRAIEETLSADNVLPCGRHVEFDLEDLMGTTDLSDLTPAEDTPDNA